MSDDRQYPYCAFCETPVAEHPEPLCSPGVVRDLRAELATVRARTIRDGINGRIPLAEIAAAQGIDGPQNTEELHASVPVSDEEAAKLDEEPEGDLRDRYAEALMAAFDQTATTHSLRIEEGITGLAAGIE